MNQALVIPTSSKESVLAQAKSLENQLKELQLKHNQHKLNLSAAANQFADDTEEPLNQIYTLFEAISETDINSHPYLKKLASIGMKLCNDSICLRNEFVNLAVGEV